MYSYLSRLLCPLLLVGTSITVVPSSAQEHAGGVSVLSRDEAAAKASRYCNELPVKIDVQYLDQLIRDSPASAEAVLAFSLRCALLEENPSIEDYNAFIERYPDRAATQAAIHEVFRLYRQQHRVSGYLDFIKRYRWVINDRSEKESKEHAGSEARWASICVRNYRGLRPDVQIDIPTLEDYSGFPASQMVRDRVVDLIERFLPEALIDGKRPFYEKQLRIHNATDQRVRVWVQRRTRIRNRHYDYDWKWTPSGPGTCEAHTLELDPGDSVVPPPRREKELLLTIPFSASRVRVWAESESGERWVAYRNRDLWLVPKNPDCDNERKYYAEEMQVHTHVIEPRSGPRIYTERVLAFENHTEEKLTVNLRYCTHRDGESRWLELDNVEVPPGEPLYPRGADGMVIRASQVRFTAQGDNLYFGAHRERPLRLVQEGHGRAMYRAERIGKLVYTFSPPDASRATE